MDKDLKIMDEKSCGAADATYFLEEIFDSFLFRMGSYAHIHSFSQMKYTVGRLLLSDGLSYVIT